jgi:hypothetical protein
MLREFTNLKDDIRHLINTKETEDETAESASEKSAFGAVRFFLGGPSLKNKLQLICLKELNSSVSMVVDSLTNGPCNTATSKLYDDLYVLYDEAVRDTLSALQAIIYMGEGKGPTGEPNVFYIDRFYSTGGDVYYITPIANPNSSRTSRIFQKAAGIATEMKSALSAPQMASTQRKGFNTANQTKDDIRSQFYKWLPLEMLTISAPKMASTQRKDFNTANQTKDDEKSQCLLK